MHFSVFAVVFPLFLDTKLSLFCISNMQNEKSRIVAIITAGGSGKRFHSKTKKQFLEISGRPLLFWTIDKFYFQPEIDSVIVSLPEDDFEITKQRLLKEFPKIEITVGGKERQDSVYNALLSCPENTDFVLIHDGVRPFIPKQEISESIRKVKEHKAVIIVSKMKNTIKKVDQEKIIETIPHEDLMNALTPQVFDFHLIKKYHEQARYDGLYFTDDAAILEYFGEQVYHLEGSSGNFKITELIDFEIAKIILEKNL